MSKISNSLSQSFCFSHLSLGWGLPLLYGTHASLWAADPVCTWALNVWHTALKWFCLTDALYVLPNVWHCLCMCTASHNSQFSVMCSFFCSLGLCLLPIYLCLLFCTWSKSLMLWCYLALFLYSLHFDSLDPHQYLVTLYFLCILLGFLCEFFIVYAIYKLFFEFSIMLFIVTLCGS